MSEVVDNVARAICTRRNIYGDDCIARNEAGTVTCGCGRREAFEADARAVILVQREPTAAMMRAGSMTGDDSEGDAKFVWQAMIDEALK